MSNSACCSLATSRGAGSRRVIWTLMLTAGSLELALYCTCIHIWRSSHMMMTVAVIAYTFCVMCSDWRLCTASFDPPTSELLQSSAVVAALHLTPARNIVEISSSWVLTAGSSHESGLDQSSYCEPQTETQSRLCYSDRVAWFGTTSAHHNWPDSVSAGT